MTWYDLVNLGEGKKKRTKKRTHVVANDSSPKRHAAALANLTDFPSVSTGHTWVCRETSQFYPLEEGKKTCLLIGGLPLKSHAHIIGRGPYLGVEPMYRNSRPDDELDVLLRWSHASKYTNSGYMRKNMEKNIM